jgi:hypothetical protein
MRFFSYSFLIMFVYFWFPKYALVFQFELQLTFISYIFQALSFFNWTTWAAPNNVLLAAATGALSSIE